MDSMKKRPLDLVRLISEEFMPLGNLSVKVVKELSKAIFPNVTVTSSTLNVQWKRLFKASGDDGGKRLRSSASRFHAACDGKGATMTIVRMKHIEYMWSIPEREYREEEISVAGYNAEVG
jgi:hypothetical protein